MYSVNPSEGAIECSHGAGPARKEISPQMIGNRNSRPRMTMSYKLLFYLLPAHDLIDKLQNNVCHFLRLVYPSHVSQSVNPFQLAIWDSPCDFLIQFPRTGKTLSGSDQQCRDFDFFQYVADVDGLNKRGVQCHSFRGMLLLLLAMPLIIRRTAPAADVVRILYVFIGAEI